MYKIIEPQQSLIEAEPIVSVIDLHEDFLTKHASADSEIAKYAKSLKPREDGIYLHINALGGENWGSNANGDYFESEVLAHECPMDGETPRMEDYGFKTFEKYAYPYKHHVNKDPEKSVGERVKFASYNPKVDRVELIVFVDRNKDPELCKKAEVGEAIPVSMGTKVLYDVCSICGNAAKKTVDYCEHLKYAMNKTLGDGRKVYAMNKYPRFFDISFVLVPAEKASYVMNKVASARSSQIVVPSAFIAEALKIEEPKRAEDKSAEIKKEIPITEVQTEQPGRDVIKSFSSLVPKVTSLEPSLSEGTMEELADFPLSDILSTATGMGMVLKPGEFTRIVVIKGAKPAEKPAEQPEISPDAINTKVASILKDYVVDRSSFRPALRARLVKLANQGPVTIDETLQQDVVSKGLPSAAALTALYDMYRSKVNKMPGGYLTQALERKPLLGIILGAIAAAGLGLSQSLEKTAKLGRAGKAAVVGSLAYPYFVKAHKEQEYFKKGKPPGDIGKLFIKHPGLIGLASLYPTLKVMRKFASVSDVVRQNKVLTWPLVEDAPVDMVDRAIVNGFVNL